MNRTLGVAFVTAPSALSSGGSEPPGVFEHRASVAAGSVTEDLALCEQIERFALGCHAADDLPAVVDKRGRLAALFNVGAALPRVHAWRRGIDDGTRMAMAMDAVAVASAAPHLKGHRGHQRCRE